MYFRLPKASSRKSLRQEREIATDARGRRVAGSGNQPGNKGDVRVAGAPWAIPGQSTSDLGWLVEAKCTDSPRYSLSLKVWRKIESEAIRACKEPALVVEVAGRKLVVVSYDAWLAMRGA